MKKITFDPLHIVEQIIMNGDLCFWRDQGGVEKIFPKALFLQLRDQMQKSQLLRLFLICNKSVTTHGIGEQQTYLLRS